MASTAGAGPAVVSIQEAVYTNICLLGLRPEKVQVSTHTLMRCTQSVPTGVFAIPLTRLHHPPALHLAIPHVQAKHKVAIAPDMFNSNNKKAMEVRCERSHRPCMM